MMINAVAVCRAVVGGRGVIVTAPRHIKYGIKKEPPAQFAIMTVVLKRTADKPINVMIIVY
jgi:hypothetical protein